MEIMTFIVYLLTNVIIGVCAQGNLPLWSPQNCSPSCYCSYTEQSLDTSVQQAVWLKTVDCNGRRMKKLPKAFPVDTQMINLEENLLSNFDELQQKVTSLQNVTDVLISHNNLSTFESNHSSFSVQQLDASENDISELATLFLAFPNLKTLSLTRNSIEKIGHVTCNKTINGLKYLDLNYNHIRSLSWIRMCGVLNSLITLDIGGNKMQSKSINDSSFLNLQELEILVLEDMGVKVINDNAFQGLVALKSLDLSDNQLSFIPTKALATLSRLRSLNLNGNMFQKIQSKAFSGLQHLEMIELTRDSLLEIVDDDAFSYLPSLNTVLLFNNQKLAYISKAAFNQCPNLSTLDLHNTMIETLHGNTVAKLGSLKNLNLRKNPINCNCMMKWAQPWMKHVPDERHGIFTEDVICASPPQFRGSRLAEVDFDQVTCAPTVQPTLPLHIMATKEETLTLNCRAFGNPTPTIFWNIPSGNTINTESKIQGVKMSTSGTLTVKNPKNGSYTCKAENSRGMAKRDVLVKVRFESSAETSKPHRLTTGVASRDVSTTLAFHTSRESLPITTSQQHSTESTATRDAFTSLPFSNVQKNTLSKETSPMSMKPILPRVPSIKVLKVTDTNALITWSSRDLDQSFKIKENKIMKISLKQNGRLIYAHEVQPYNVLPNWEIEGPEYNISLLTPGETYVVCLIIQCCHPKQEKQSCSVIRTALNKNPSSSNKTAIVLSLLTCFLLLVTVFLLVLCYGRNCRKFASARWNEELYEGLEEIPSDKEETGLNDTYEPLIQDSWKNDRRSSSSDRLIDTSYSTVYM